MSSEIIIDNFPDALRNMIREQMNNHTDVIKTTVNTDI